MIIIIITHGTSITSSSTIETSATTGATFILLVIFVTVTLVMATLVEDCAVGVMVTGLLLAIEDVFAILMLIMAAVSDNGKAFY